MSILDEDAVVAQTQYVFFPSSIDVSAANSGVVMAKNSRFAAIIGSGGVGDLVIVRPNASGIFEGVLVDYAGGAVPALDTRPLISPDGRWVATLGAGTTSDLVITPIADNASGLVTPGTPVTVSYPTSNNVPQLTGIRLYTTFDGDAIVTTGTLIAGDIVVTSIPDPFAAPGIATFNVSYPSSNSIPQPVAPILVSPDGSWCATFGQSTVGDIVVTPLSATGVPSAAQNVLFPSSNNAVDQGSPIACDPRGRVVGTVGTLSTGDLVLVPISAAGVPGAVLNVNYPSSNFVPAGSPAATIDPTGRFAVTAGSGSTGDLVVTSLAYNASNNTVAASALNVLFPNAVDRRATASEWSIAEDGALIAVLGSNQTLADLVMVPVSTAGIPGAAINIAYPNSINVPSFQGAPAIDPRCDWIVTAGDDVLSDLVLIPIERDANCLAVPGTLELHVFPNANNVLGTTEGPRAAPSGQFLLTRGATNIGDFVISPIDDARVFLLDPPCIGTTVRLRLRSPGDGGLPFVLAASLNRCPGITLSDGRIVELTSDFVLAYSLLAPNPTFIGFQGVLDPNDQAEALFAIPFLPDFRGLPFYFAFAVYDGSAPTGFGTLSRPAAVVLE